MIQEISSASIERECVGVICIFGIKPECAAYIAVQVPNARHGATITRYVTIHRVRREQSK
jgi:hypothetical protein